METKMENDISGIIKDLSISTGYIGIGLEGKKTYNDVTYIYNGSQELSIDIPKKTSALSNDSRYVTMSALQPYVTREWIFGNGVSHFRNDAKYITMNALSAYPTKNWLSSSNVSQFKNDVGYTKKSDVQEMLSNVVTKTIRSNVDQVNLSHLMLIDNSDTRYAQFANDGLTYTYANDQNIHRYISGEELPVKSTFIREDHIEVREEWLNPTLSNLFNETIFQSDCFYHETNGLSCRYDYPNASGRLLVDNNISGLIATINDLTNKVNQLQQKVEQLESRNTLSVVNQAPSEEEQAKHPNVIFLVKQS